MVPDVIDSERWIDTRTHQGLCALHLAVLGGSQAAGEGACTCCGTACTRLRTSMPGAAQRCTSA